MQQFIQFKYVPELHAVECSVVQLTCINFKTKGTGIRVMKCVCTMSKVIQKDKQAE